MARCGRGEKTGVIPLGKKGNAFEDPNENTRVSIIEEGAVASRRRERSELELGGGRTYEPPCTLTSGAGTSGGRRPVLSADDLNCGEFADCRWRNEVGNAEAPATDKLDLRRAAGEPNTERLNAIFHTRESPGQHPVPPVQGNVLTTIRSRGRVAPDDLGLQYKGKSWSDPFQSRKAPRQELRDGEFAEGRWGYFGSRAARGPDEAGLWVSDPITCQEGDGVLSVRCPLGSHLDSQLSWPVAQVLAVARHSDAGVHARGGRGDQLPQLL